MILHNPEHDFWRTGHPDHEAETMGFGRAKFIWALSLLSSPRGIGWNFQLKTLRIRQKLVGKPWFVLWQLLRAGVFTGVSWAVKTLLERQHATSPQRFSKALAVPGIAAMCWADIEAQYAVCNAVFLMVGLAEEQDCLPPCGTNIISLDSLQEFWGQFWQQTHRIMFQDFGRAMVWLMGIRPYSQLSRLVQVWTAFAISGAVHGFALSIGIGAEGVSARFWAVFAFFILQALGITIEELFLLTPGRDLTLYEIGLEDEMIMGRIWTFGWLLFSGYWAMDSWFERNWMPLSTLTALTMLSKRPWRPNRME
ncbi:hypothetical protein B0T16DRAFT_392117 [Cercophora newfieldiana]|uniref:Wax synthase domain-containing protein n=1 Tax=Cercophora newfieldiana TaxID=92897 RepID=A0AA39Y0A4_9PEZI|nr:hypothetical protein B0T16DRAFT_392117 [Cercophora newfieldiana]